MAKLKEAIQKEQQEENIAPVEAAVDSKVNLHAEIVHQIEQEYTLAWKFQKPWLQKQYLRLKVYNNQKRDEKKVGDNTMFTIHQTILSALYGEDELLASFNAREEGDHERAENYESLAMYDNDIMQKGVMDYFWDWDATFFGRAPRIVHDFDRLSKTPMPEDPDPLTLLRDPNCIALNGDPFGRGAARFWGRPIRKTLREMKDPAYGYFNIFDKDSKKPLIRKQTSTTSSQGTTQFDNLIAEARQARRDAQGYDNFQEHENQLDENYEYELLQWFTYWEGNPYIVELANDRKLIVRVIALPKKTNMPWPVTERTIFPISNDYNGVSIPDLTEDKQRMRAELLNLGVDVAKSSLHGGYIYNINLIRNPNHLNFKLNKHVPVQGNPNNAVVPRRTQQIDQTADYILQSLETAAEKATATPSTRQGMVTKERRTLGEIELAASGSGQRHSLPAKIFGWSEKEFWRLHMMNYKENFKEDIDEKVARIQGPFGNKWEPFKREDIVPNHPLGYDIEIESRVISEAKKTRQYVTLQQYFSGALQLPGARQRYAFKKLGRLAPDLTKSELNRLLPPTIDEMEAEEENEELNNNNKVPVLREQDHRTHLEMHMTAKDTKALQQHISAHKMAMKLARRRPDLFPGMQEEQPINFNLAPATPAGTPDEGREQAGESRRNAPEAQQQEEKQEG